MTTITVQAARVRIQIEFIEMPGLRLSGAQVARLCALPPDISAAALQSLTDAGFLRETSDGVFERRTTRPSVDADASPDRLPAAS